MTPDRLTLEQAVGKLAMLNYTTLAALMIVADQNNPDRKAFVETLAKLTDEAAYIARQFTDTPPGGEHDEG